MGRRTTAADPARPRQGGRRDPRVARREAAEQPAHPRPGPQRRRPGRHLPDQQPPAHALRQGPRERLADRHGLIEGACRHVIEDRFGITGARWSPDGAEDILKLRAVVINGDLHAYLAYYKQRYLREHHLTRYDPASIPNLGPIPTTA